MAATTQVPGTRKTPRSLTAYALLLPGYIAFGLFFLVPAVLLAWLSSPLRGLLMPCQQHLINIIKKIRSRDIITMSPITMYPTNNASH